MQTSVGRVAGAVAYLVLSLLAVTGGQGGAATATDVAVRAFPGESGLIAFERNGDIWTMRADGTQQLPVFEAGGEQADPAFSPDGTRIAFSWTVTDGEGGFVSSDLWIVDRDGTDPTQVATEGDAGQPAWSPDGRRLAYVRSFGEGGTRIWSIGVDGSADAELAAVDGAPFHSAPAWSPDGSRLAFSATTFEGGEIPIARTRVWTSDADGGDPVALLPDEPRDQYSPDWAPDGARLVFTIESGSGVGDVHTAAPDGSDLRQLTTDEDGVPVDDRAPAWSPDGRSIAFARSALSEGSDPASIWTMDADDGSDQVERTPGAASSTAPTWQAAPEVAALSVDPAARVVEVGGDAVFLLTAVDSLGLPVHDARLLVGVSGDHSRRFDRTTDQLGQARVSLTEETPGTDTVLACADLDGDDTCGPTEPAATATVLWRPPQPVTPPRLAFTDDADVLYAQRLRRVEDPDGGLAYQQVGRPFYATDGLSGFDRGATHEGEASRVAGTSAVFVSTRDSAEGDVYRSASPPVRVTCESGTETHPVADTFGHVAYASDADGDWDVYVASPPDGPGGCEAWTVVNVTDEAPGEPAYDDLWPTWTWEAGEGAYATGLVFSRTAPGALPDLWRTDLLEVGTTDFAAPVPVQVTPYVAESQPAAMVQATSRTSRHWVAFTTTERRSSGSIAVLDLDAPGDGFLLDPVLRQGSEPAWSSPVNPANLAFTSRNDDPYGDIAIAEVRPPQDADGPGLEDVDVFGVRTVPGAVTGVGESHPAWVREIGEDLDGEGVLVFTSRATYVDDVAPGSRVLDADVSDVRWTDGTQRRVIRRARETEDDEVVWRYDEAGPSYSPDGTRIVYSADTRAAEGGPETRVLMVADADGSNPARLLPAGQRLPLDVDLDPVWSPDGDRVAFVRVRQDPGGPPGGGPPAVWVHDLRTGVTTRMAGGVGEEQGPELSPSWAPDARHLVVSRVVGLDRSEVADGARRWTRTPLDRKPLLWVLDVGDPTGPGASLDTCGKGCAVSGRSPAWSPDGRTIAYELDGQLLTVDLDGPCCADAGDPVQVGRPAPVVGFVPVLNGEGDLLNDEPTPARTVVATAQDPAWSPDGTEIAFSGQPEGRPDAAGIYGVAPDGTGLRVITDEPGPESEPAYQPQPDEPEPEPSADLAVTVSVSGSPALVGAPVVATFTVTNDGPDPATDVVLLTAFPAGADRSAPTAPPGCRVDGAGCDFAVLAPGASRQYAVRLRHTTRVLGTATGSVASAVPDPDLLDNVDTALYRVQGADVRVRITVDEPVGYAGGRREVTVTVRNPGTDPVDDVEVTATWPVEVVPSVPPVGPSPPGPVTPPAPACLVAGDPCAIGTIGAGGRRRYRVVLGTPVEATVLLAAEVTTSTPETTLDDNSDDVGLEVLQPVLSLLPGVAPPGKVVLAYGEDLPPGSLVRLRWRRGITVDRRLVRVADDGTVRVPVLVVRHDLLGERALRAVSRRRLFAPVAADLLVVPRTLTPPTFNGRG